MIRWTEEKPSESQLQLEAGGLEALDVAVRLQRREDDVHQPQAEEQAGSQDFRNTRPAELPADGWPAPVDQDGDADESKDGEERDGEGQRSRVHPELLALAVVVDGGDGPRHANAQEDVDSVTSCNVPDGGVRVLVLGCCYFTGKGV